MLSIAQIEFLSEKQLIQIVPNFNHGRMYLISGDVGPFAASLPVSVPMWLAINLKQREKCRIVPPDWMDVAKLEEKRQEESESSVFTKLPSTHFVEITQLLLTHAITDVPHADEIRALVKDIWDLRMAKLRNSVDTFIRSESSHAKLDHLTVMEINIVRKFLTTALDHMTRLRQSVITTVEDDSQDV